MSLKSELWGLQYDTLSLVRVSVMKTNLQAVRHTGTDHSEPDESRAQYRDQSEYPESQREASECHQIWLKMYDGQLHLSTSNMNTVNSPTKINHVFIVYKTIYNIESDTVQMTQKNWRKRLNSVIVVEIINIPVSLWWIGAWCQTPDREQLLNVKIVLWHTLTVAEKVLGFLTHNLYLYILFSILSGGKLEYDNYNCSTIS